MTIHRSGLSEAEIEAGTAQNARPIRVHKALVGSSSMAFIPEDRWEKAFGRRSRFADVTASTTPPPVKADGAFGKHQNGRQAIDRMTGHLAREGLLTPGDLHADQARAIATAAAHRHDDRILGTPDAESVGRHHTPLSPAKP